ncbi:UNVERIFIED_CONTAM: hypothetical protein LK11_04695 [Mumia flava]
MAIMPSSEAPQPAPTTDAGRAALDAVVADPARALLALDFDGTLAPIVDDPEQAAVHPRAVAALDRIGPCLGKVAVVTGRPVLTALRLGGFDDRPGLSRLSILGQYGAERWDAQTGEADIPPPPAAIAEVESRLPRLLDDLGLGDVALEKKGRAVVLHTRRLADPAEAQRRLAGPVAALARSHGLAAEQGRNVIEVRDPSVDKGRALRDLVAQTGATAVVYAGDDLGDLPAYVALQSMRAAGEVRALLVAVASAEQPALVPRSDLAVDGPEELADWLERLADRLGC